MSIAQMWEAGGQAAREDQKRKALRDFMQPALGGDKQAISGLFGAGAAPEAMQAMEFGQGQQDRSRKQLADLSNLMISAPQMAAQVYPQWKAAIESSGLGVGLPDQFEEGALEAAKAFSTAGGEEQYTLSPGAARYDGSGRLIAERPFAPKGFDGTWDSDRGMWIPKPGGAGAAMDQAYGAATSAPQQQGGDPFASLLAGVPGLRVTSRTRTPEENAKLPNSVPNSFHLTGQAIDIGTPTPEQLQGIRQWAAQNGHEVITNYKDGHVHLEPKGRPSAPQQGGLAGIPVAGVGPKAPKETDLERRVRMARDMGASEDDIRNIVIGREGAAAGSKPMPAAALRMVKEETDAANTAQQINATIDGHLSRITSGKLDFGMASNLLNQGKLAIGKGDEEARNFQEFKSDLEKLRNDSLRLNNGVQTDGDAQRAWNELVANLNDTGYVKQRLETIKQLNARAEMLRRENAEMVLQNYGRGADSQQAAPRQDAPQGNSIQGWSIQRID